MAKPGFVPHTRPTEKEIRAARIRAAKASRSGSSLMLDKNKRAYQTGFAQALAWVLGENWCYHRQHPAGKSEVK
jgi:hypothetical protein